MLSKMNWKEKPFVWKRYIKTYGGVFTWRI